MTKRALHIRHSALAVALLLALVSISRGAGPTTTPAVDQDTVTVDAATDRAIHGGMRFLAGKQQADGSWGQDHRAAITAYCMISFMASGNLPDEGEFGANVTRSQRFLMQCARPDGFIAAPTG